MVQTISYLTIFNATFIGERRTYYTENGSDYIQRT
jgi:hypothetical protein